MEKILRKVNCKDRLPSNKQFYYVVLKYKRDEEWADKAVREYSPSYNQWWLDNVEYWYEEVDLMRIAVDSIINQFSKKDIETH